MKYIFSYAYVLTNSLISIYFSSDIDECGIFHGCQEKCINTVGDYHCACSKGYRLKDDKRTCTGILHAFEKKKDSSQSILWLGLLQ